jgi:hypothetical protein
VLRKIFGPKRDKVTGGWRKFHYEGLYYLYCLPNIIWVKSRHITWQCRWHAWQRRETYSFMEGKSEERYVFEDHDIYVRIKLSEP